MSDLLFQVFGVSGFLFPYFSQSQVLLYFLPVITFRFLTFLFMLHFVNVTVVYREIPEDVDYSLTHVTLVTLSVMQGSDWSLFGSSLRLLGPVGHCSGDPGWVTLIGWQWVSSNVTSKFTRRVSFS